MKEHAEKTVVVTGASSGIGRASALLLARRGFRVFAGVRKQKDGDSLRAASGGSVVPVEIDVTDRATIASAAMAVHAEVGDRGLDGLVNNAGIATPAPIEYMSADVLRRQFEVNVFGQVAVTQAFLPLIRRARGRIVNVGSVGSHIALPFGGALCGSKGAFTLLSDALRLELRPFGIHVCLIEPGAISTPAVDKTLGDAEAIIRALPAEGEARYGAKLREFMRRGHARETNGSPPEVVAEAIVHALTARRPRVRYPVGADARMLVTLPRVLPDRVLDQVRLRMLGMPTEFGCEPATEVPVTDSRAAAGVAHA
ncbi:MAG TPA: SDR family oxidoreductase [Polyangiaceae bacterium]|jgi:NAD(P)-dependent dehydrogenase (short-subunit alcohol dehydrogenase family)